MRDLRQEEIDRYRERLRPYIDAVMSKYEHRERRQKMYDYYIEKLKKYEDE